MELTRTVYLKTSPAAVGSSKHRNVVFSTVVMLKEKLNIPDDVCYEDGAGHSVMLSEEELSIEGNALPDPLLLTLAIPHQGISEDIRYDPRLHIWDGLLQQQSESDRGSQHGAQRKLMVEGFGHAECMLSGSKPSLAHILPVRHADRAGLFRMKAEDVFSVRNGLPLCKDLEEEFDNLQWTLVYDPSSQNWNVWVFDRNCKAEPYHNTVVTLNYVPFKRIVGWHARACIEKAKVNQWMTRVSSVDWETFEELSFNSPDDDEVTQSTLQLVLTGVPPNVSMGEVQAFLAGAGLILLGIWKRAQVWVVSAEDTFTLELPQELHIPCGNKMKSVILARDA